MAKKRIGLFIDNIDEYNTGMINGAAAACAKLDYELVLFYGYGLNAHSQKKEAFITDSFAYEFVNTVGIERLLLSINLNDKKNRELAARFKMPCITLNNKYEGFPAILFDNKKGVKEAISFLIEEDKRQRIGVIAGPRNRPGTIERVTAYKEALHEHNMLVDEDLIVYAADYTEYNSEIIGTFFDQHNDLDGVFCVTDRLANCAYQELIKRQYVIGVDISVIGFDDNSIASNMLPPLATIHADSAMLAYRAVIESEEDAPNKTIILPTNFIIRSSVKSDYGNENELYNMINDAIDHHYGTSFLAAALSIYLYNDKVMFSSALKEETTHLFKVILDDFLYASDIGELKRDLPICFGPIFTTANIPYIDLDRLLRILRVFADIIRSKKIIEANRFDYFGEYVLGEITRVYANYSSIMEKSLVEKEFGVTTTNKISLSFVKADNPFSMIAETLQRLNVQNAAILMLEEPIVYQEGSSFTMPDRLILKVHLKNGLAIRCHDESYRQDEILNIIENKNSVILSAIGLNEIQYGVLLAEMEIDELSIIEYASSQFGIVFYIQSLMSQLESRSLTDELTRFYNRRGIVEKIRKELNKRTKGNHFIFFDLDGLKGINDNYGHEAGDKAILMARDIIQSVLPEAIKGRWGGDEFVAFTHEKIDPVELDKAFNEATLFYTLRNQYPFAVTLSYGLSDIRPDFTKEEIAQAIERADAKMYAVKKAKKKR